MKINLLQAAEGAAGAAGDPAPEGPMGGWGQIALIAVIGVVFYMFLIRPNQKKQKAAKAFRQNLGKGDRIVTIGGVHGKVESLKDATVVISVEDGTKMQIERSAIASQFSEEGLGQKK
ncbi:MAG: preprotein translocase subunit YajC [Parvicellaceae bacterium]|jgi:preprotein translocase subunit YajC